MKKFYEIVTQNGEHVGYFSKIRSVEEYLELSAFDIKNPILVLGTGMKYVNKFENKEIFRIVIEHVFTD